MPQLGPLPSACSPLLRDLAAGPLVSHFTNPPLLIHPFSFSSSPPSPPLCHVHAAPLLNTAHYTPPKIN
ncbi:hypothetical protein EYF80_042423 [Liparis tanakae]|uniref:Uncharacterized protein n=1 Tax=Liparis tanakae TaxID=230148 RepID=A0A4Z2G291_9TELE|nr:hypothetical protein EYF80_042423 [Liparis tanakae]